jgi:hypothetical protein
VKSITLNDKLIANEIGQTKRLACLAVLIIPIWLIAVFVCAAYLRHLGDNEGVRDMHKLSLIIPMLMIPAFLSEYFKLRILRKIPITTITETEIRIGELTIPQSEILRIETATRGRNKRRLKLHFQNGSSKLIRIPKPIAPDDVKALFSAPITITNRNLLYPP